ncbi:MAG: DUF3501 family protein [Nitrospirales bacterium]
MKFVTPQELLSAADYEEQRADIRQRIIGLKKRRRLTVGEYITLVFENRETVLFQIQEMLRTERIFAPEKIQEECDVYNALLPGIDELSATLYIEITDADNIQKLLDSLKGIDNPDIVAICIGKEKIFANFEAGHSNEEKISAVHFVRFPSTPNFRDQLAQTGKPAILTINHPNFQAEAPIPDEMRQEWLQDLQ